MALLKAHTTPSGVTGNYWKVVETNINHYDKRGRLTIACFVDEAARHAGKAPLDVRAVDVGPPDTIPQPAVYDEEANRMVEQPPVVLPWPFDLAALSESNPVALAYGAIRARDAFFKDAEDDI